MACSFCGREKEQARGLCGGCYSRWSKTGNPAKTKVKKIGACSCCGKVKYIAGRDLCRACYLRWSRNGSPEKKEKRVAKVAACEFCKKIAKIEAKGLCSACYQRVGRHGSPEYAFKGKGKCSLAGCEDTARTSGLCSKHYARKRRDDPDVKAEFFLYSTWHSMKNRCLNPNCKSYPDYGGRGITVCDKWINDYKAFEKDMGPKPTPSHSIDRVDNSKGYSPDNCRWATRIEQRHNTDYTTLDELMVVEIRKAVREGVSFADLSKKYNCYLGTISDAAHGITWGDIPGAIDIKYRKKKYTINEASVIEIRRQILSGESVKSLSEKYHVAESSIRRAASGARWKSVPGALGPDLAKFRKQTPCIPPTNV